MKRSRSTAAAAAGFALALALAACSTGESADPDPAGPDAGQQTEEMTEETEDPTTEEPTDTAEGTEDPHAGHDLSSVQPTATGDPFADIRTAAEHMPQTGETLASGLAAALEMSGDASSEAAALRSGLTALLQEHVYLAGIAVATAYTTGPDSAEFELAGQAVDANSQALAEAVGELAGEEAGEQFLTRWRDHIGYFVDYAVAVASDDQDGADAAVSELREYTQEAGLFFEEVSGGELSAADVTASLDMHVDTLATAVDSLAAGDTDAYANLAIASGHVAADAAVLATGLATAAELDGDPNDEASTLRAALTANLNEHVYVAGIAVFVAYTEGPDSEAFAAAAEVVDLNAVALADAVGALAGADYRDPFLELWRDHIGYFVDYAVAVAGNDQDAADQALADLDDYRFAAGDFFAEISGGELPAEAVAEGLAHHIQTLGGAIDSLNEALVQSSDS